MKKTLSDGRVSQLKSQVNALRVLNRLLYKGVSPEMLRSEYETVQAQLHQLSETRRGDAA